MKKLDRPLATAQIAEYLGGTLAGPDVALIEVAVEGEPLSRAPSSYPRLSADAAACLEAVQRRDWAELKGRIPRGLPHFDGLAGFFAPEEFVFLDIETMGLSFVEDIFLVGTLRWRDGRWLLRQAVLLSLDNPVDLLRRVDILFDGALACATYNGISFDIPFLRFALGRHGLGAALLDSLFPFDLLYSTRRRYRGVLPNCKLKTVEEQVLGVRRLDDVPGFEVPRQFAQFARTRDPVILARILEHNRQDLLSLKEITSQEILFLFSSENA